MLSPTKGQVAHALLTRSPLEIYRSKNPVRLACVKHAASVRPEPRSNSPKILFFREPIVGSIQNTDSIFVLLLITNSILKESNPEFY